MSAAAAPQPLDVLTCPLTEVNLIEASAGTGKTWTICGLYLRLLVEERRSVQEILVVTFTQAATAELRERIRARILDLLAHLRNTPTSRSDPFIEHLAAKLTTAGISTDDIDSRLALALHSFDEAAILSIHGFCSRALADSPFAAGLPMHTEVVHDDHDLLMQAVHDFWRRHVAGNDLPDEFVRYLRIRGDTPEAYAALLRRHLAKPLARVLWPSRIDAPPIAAATLEAPYRAACAEWQARRDEILGVLHRALHERELNGNTYKAAALQKAQDAWDEICDARDPLMPLPPRAVLLTTPRLTAGTNKNCTTPVDPFFALAATFVSQREAFDESLRLMRLRLLRRLFTEARERLRAQKRLSQVVTYDDMLSNLQERLHDPAYPDLASSLRQKFPAALIDEFQDTDPQQLAIFQAIYATGEHCVFLVGDPKQAIYGFRHADVHSYLRAARWAVRAWSLPNNQRSTQPLLNAQNALFGANPDAFVLPEIRHRNVGFGSKPRATLIDRSAPRAPLQIWQLPQTARHLFKEEAKQAVVAATAAEIARLLQAADDGLVTLDGAPLRPRDIAVLVRSRALGTRVKRELTALCVGAVELSGDGIFASHEARDWEAVLRAIASPAREPLLRAALATPLIGIHAAQLAALSTGETGLSDWILRFMAYRELWLSRGFGVMYRQLLIDHAVAERLLAAPNGERRLTNCLHVAEELQQAAQRQGTPEALLRFLRDAETEGDVPETAELRLESDQNLVQIVTVHVSKGLEYPIIFCPFINDGFVGRGARRKLEGLEYHDGALLPVIDYEVYDVDDARKRAIDHEIAVERVAENARLIYVALTRAIHRCYFTIGPYVSNRSTQESDRAMINWLAAGDGMAVRQWLGKTEESKAKPARALSSPPLDAAWRRLVTVSGGALSIDPLPLEPGVPLRPKLIAAEDLTTPTPPAVIAPGWRSSSYSSLSYGAGSEIADDHDARVTTAPVSLMAVDLPSDDILRFPRGAEAGECIHAVFERVDFTHPAGWNSAIAAALVEHPATRGQVPAAVVAGEAADHVQIADTTGSLSRMLHSLVEDVTTTTLRPGLTLRNVPPSRRLVELEFDMPVAHLTAATLNAVLERLGYDVPALAFGQLEGYLKGFIDLVFEHDGRYFILDWKSNHLGYTAMDYAAASLARAMAEHGYHLQYLLYCVALHRYLRGRLRTYDYEKHFGGVLYLFVRGVRPAWTIRRSSGEAESPETFSRPGVFFHRPPSATLQELDELFADRAVRPSLPLRDPS